MSKKLKLLLVEDSELDAELVIRRFKKDGWDLEYERVDEAETMAAALDKGGWELVISDYHLPRFTAPEALHLMKSKNLDLPFIIVSGTVGEEAAVDAMRAGAHDFMAKDRLIRLVPVVERELREASVRADRKKMQEHMTLSDRMAAMGMLAAGVGHEINNPLSAVSANLEYVLGELERARSESPSTKDQILRELPEPIKDAKEAAERIRQIAKDLKMFSRTDEHRRPIDVRHVVESSRRMAWHEIRQRASMVSDLAEVPLVLGDEGRLGQVFLNLLVNAAQALPEGRTSENQIRAKTFVDQSGRVVVEISDNGPGIPPEIQPRIFEPFFTTKPIGVGTGLGLAICHRIVRDLGGDISVESEPGKGAAFRVSLPAIGGDIEGRVTGRHPAAAASRRGRILVIEDERTYGTAIGRYLKREHEVAIVPTAAEALELIAKGDRFDVIVCDLLMPAMSGMELFFELEKIAPDQAEKLLFATAGNLTREARVFLSQVQNARIEKPFTAENLRTAVNRLVR